MSKLIGRFGGSIRAPNWNLLRRFVSRQRPTRVRRPEKKTTQKNNIKLNKKQKQDLAVGQQWRNGLISRIGGRARELDPGIRCASTISQQSVTNIALKGPKNKSTDKFKRRTAN